MSYSSGYETTHLFTYAFRRRARGVGGGLAFLRRLRPAPLPDPPFECSRRKPATDSPLSLGCASQTVRNAIPDFNRRGLGALTAGSSRPKRTRAAFDEEDAEALRELLHHSPREFGKESTLWSLEYAAEVSFEEGITQEKVGGETIRATLERLGVRWERAKRWISSPDPEYARKKGLEIG